MPNSPTRWRTVEFSAIVRPVVDRARVVAAQRRPTVPRVPDVAAAAINKAAVVLA